MNDLPNSLGMSGKEQEGIHISQGENSSVQEVGKDIELPKEVSAVGVSVHPTSAVVSQQVQSLGVTVSGNQIPVGNGSSVTLPLTSSQITLGLHQSITSSFRWLAEWCLRKLKQIHKSLVKSS